MIVPMTIGVVVEVLTLVTLMIVLASGHFSIYGLALGMLGILTPLLLAARSFWLMSRDEANALQMMQEREATRSTASAMEMQLFSAPPQTTVAQAPRKDAVPV